MDIYTLIYYQVFSCFHVPYLVVTIVKFNDLIFYPVYRVSTVDFRPSDYPKTFLPNHHFDFWTAKTVRLRSNRYTDMYLVEMTLRAISL